MWEGREGGREGRSNKYRVKSSGDKMKGVGGLV